MLVNYKKLGLFLLGPLIIVGAGTFWIDSTAKRIHNEGLQELLYVNELVMAAVDASSYEGLTYTAADSENPVYQRLRAKLKKIEDSLKSRFRIRGSYIMKQIDDEIMFVVDAAAVEDPFHAEPGTPYELPPDDLLSVISDGQARTAGPYTDEYGTYYSVFSAHRDSTDSVIAYVATDIEQVDFDAQVWEGIQLTIFISLSVLLLYVALFFIAERWLYSRRHKKEREQEQLRRAKEIETMLLNIGEGVVAFDDAGEVMFANRFALESVCHGDTSCLTDANRNRWQLVDEDGEPINIQPQSANEISSEPPTDDEKAVKPYIRRVNGELFPVSISMVKLELGPGSPATIMTFRDSTRETEMDRMKTDFINVAVHQLKTPLAALKWSVELLSEATKESKLSGDEETMIGDIGEVTQRLNQLVTALLNVARVESGRLTVDPKPTDLGVLATDVIAENKSAANLKQQTVTLSVADGLPQISVDPLLVREVFKNLLTNAIKYSPKERPIEVHIGKQGGEIVCAVKDHGYGIPFADQKRVFHRFFRAENAASQTEDGTGLGLYFAKQIVDVSGGRLWFESTEGVGTTFYFSLPLEGSEAKKGQVRLS
ncbi:MAG: HAMP domain-containing sensor histidine kinase [Patescibacteria group bacterium]